MMLRPMSLKENGVEKFVCSQLISAYALIEHMMRIKEFCQYLIDYGYYDRLREAEKIIFEASDKIDLELEKKVRKSYGNFIEGIFDGKDETSS